MNQLGVKEIFQLDEDQFAIKWSDDKEQKFNAFELRKNCPCASCVDEMTGIRKTQSFAEKIYPKTIKSVGRYAVQIEFDDNHDTGIYSFSLLRKLGSKLEA